MPTQGTSPLRQDGRTNISKAALRLPPHISNPLMTLTKGPSGGNNPWTRSTVNRNRVRALHKRTRHTATLASATDDDATANVCQRPPEALEEEEAFVVV